jgi:phosphoribosylformylglycinamidine (FGAM) synthase PurS component
MKNLGLLKSKYVSANILPLEIEAENAEVAHAKVEQACKTLLANLIMESYTFEIKAI